MSVCRCEYYRRYYAVAFDISRTHDGNLPWYDNIMWYPNKIYIIDGTGNGFNGIYWKWHRLPLFIRRTQKTRTWKSSQTHRQTHNKCVRRTVELVSVFVLWVIPTGARWRWRSRRPSEFHLPIEKWLTFIGLIQYYLFEESFFFVVAVPGGYLGDGTGYRFYYLFWFINAIRLPDHTYRMNFGFLVFASVMWIPTNIEGHRAQMAQTSHKHQNTWTIKWVTKIAWHARHRWKERDTFTRIQTLKCS